MQYAFYAQRDKIEWLEGLSDKNYVNDTIASSLRMMIVAELDSDGDMLDIGSMDSHGGLNSGRGSKALEPQKAA